MDELIIKTPNSKKLLSIPLGKQIFIKKYLCKKLLITELDCSLETSPKNH